MIKLSELAKRDPVQLTAIRDTRVCRRFRGRVVWRRLRAGTLIHGSFGCGGYNEGYVAVHVDDGSLPADYWYVPAAAFHWAVCRPVEVDSPEDDLTALEVQFLTENGLSRHQLKRLRALEKAAVDAQTAEHNQADAPPADPHIKRFEQYALKNCGFRRVAWPGLYPRVQGRAGHWEIPEPAA